MISDSDMDAYVPGVLYFRVKPDALPSDPGLLAKPLQYLRENHGLTRVQPLFAVHKPPFDGYTALTIDPRSDTRAMLRKLNSSNFVAFAERAPARYLLQGLGGGTGADPATNLQWGLRAIRYFQAAIPDAGRIKVAVIDSGADDRHPALRDAIETYRPLGPGKLDISGHGTHVAGLIAGKVDAARGIAGMANCRLSVWKTFHDTPDELGRFKADPDQFLQALGEVLSSGCTVLNLSLGGPAKSKAEQEIITALSESGVLVVAAMGNHFELGNPVTYPAAYANTLAVGAVDMDLRRARFSCTGRHIGICAPGGSILSTLPRQANPLRAKRDFGVLDGTSMAAPYVSAAAALVAAARQISGREAGQILLDTARRVPDMRRKTFTIEHGYGILDLEAALR